VRSVITFLGVFIVVIIILNILITAPSFNTLIVKVLVAGLIAGLAMWIVSVIKNKKEY